MISTIVLACLLTFSKHIVAGQTCNLPKLNVPQGCQTSSVDLPLTGFKSVCTSTTIPNILLSISGQNAPHPCDNIPPKLSQINQQNCNGPTNLPTICKDVPIVPCSSVNVQNTASPVNLLSPCQNLPAVQTNLVEYFQGFSSPSAVIGRTTPPICTRPEQLMFSVNNAPSLNQIITSNVPVSPPLNIPSNQFCDSALTLPAAPSLCEPCSSYPIPALINQQEIASTLPYQLDVSGVSNNFLNSPIGSSQAAINRLPCNPFKPLVCQEPVVPSCGIMKEVPHAKFGGCGCNSCSHTTCEKVRQNVLLPPPPSTTCINVKPIVRQNFPCTQMNTLPLYDPCIQPVPLKSFPPTYDERTVFVAPLAETFPCSSSNTIPFSNLDLCIESTPIYTNTCPCSNLVPTYQEVVTQSETVNEPPECVISNSRSYYVVIEEISYLPIIETEIPANPPSLCLNNNQLIKQVIRPTVCNDIVRTTLPLINPNQETSCLNLPKSQLPLPCQSVPSLNMPSSRPCEPCNQPIQYNNPCNQIPRLSINGCREPTTIACGTCYGLPLPVIDSGDNTYFNVPEPLPLYIYPESPCLAPMVPMVSIPELNMLDIGNSYCENPFLPAASPASSYYNAVTSLLPPVELCTCGCKEYSRLKKRIPPPFI